ncbi:hypothetical protein [Mycobacterium sp. ITM-2016-00318]|uniref:hypothetical protein n=1 Tax=Mycobacterium sp. ITM-2016-00318 TaxID=2099693 RepID=UPI000CF9396B|nr:hypothetical protein [Mycobacterium sp. ITM-2016-00318]WNG94989.1 hypothetical protein C6A82_011450 [Mycobacterium sp. ITM-2016-00318]
MITITRGLAVGAVLAGAAVGLAGPASAEPTAGNYTATIIDPGDSNKTGSTTWNLASCGPDCFNVNDTSKTLWQLHRQGTVWTGSDDINTVSLDNDSLILTLQYRDGHPNVVIGLTKV